MAGSKISNPEKLLTTPTVLSSPLLRIPTELLIQIFYYVDSLDQVCLAIACKRLLQISTSLSLKTPSPTGQRYSCPKTKLLKRLMPLDPRGRQKRTWAFCCDCVRYRPTRKTYWKAKKKRAQVETNTWEGIVKEWNVKYSLQCPECWENEAYGT